jgi:hypothetical protein
VSLSNTEIRIFTYLEHMGQLHAALLNNQYVETVTAMQKDYDKYFDPQTPLKHTVFNPRYYGSGQGQSGMAGQNNWQNQGNNQNASNNLFGKNSQHPTNQFGGQNIFGQNIAPTQPFFNFQPNNNSSAPSSLLSNNNSSLPNAQNKGQQPVNLFTQTTNRNHSNSNLFANSNPFNSYNAQPSYPTLNPVSPFAPHPPQPQLIQYDPRIAEAMKGPMMEHLTQYLLQQQTLPLIR